MKRDHAIDDDQRLGITAHDPLLHGCSSGGRRIFPDPLTPDPKVLVRLDVESHEPLADGREWIFGIKLQNGAQKESEFPRVDEGENGGGSGSEMPEEMKVKAADFVRGGFNLFHNQIIKEK